MNMVVLGSPGSGKSTQAKLLAYKLGLPHVSTGDIFRDIEQQTSDLGARVKELLSKGQLVSNEDTLEVAKQEFSKPQYQHGIIVDGFPRDLFQAQNSPLNFDQAIYFKVSDNTVVGRLLKRGREDDSEAVIRQRLKVFHEQTEPILNWYRSQGILMEVNGEPTENEIFMEICQKLHLSDE